MNSITAPSRRLFAASASALIAGATLATAASAAGRGHAPSRSEALIRRLYDAVNRKDLGVIAAYGASFSEWLDVPFDYTTKGEQAIIGPWKSCSTYSQMRLVKSAALPRWAITSWLRASGEARTAASSTRLQAFCSQPARPWPSASAMSTRYAVTRSFAPTPTSTSMGC